MAPSRSTARRRQQQRRGQHGSKEGRRPPPAIIAGVVVIALVAVAIVGVVLFNGSGDQDGHAPVTVLVVSPEDAVPGIAIGNKIPDFDFQLNNGTVISAANLVDEGQPTFYFFFATW